MRTGTIAVCFAFVSIIVVVAVPDAYGTTLGGQISVHIMAVANPNPTLRSLGQARRSRKMASKTAANRSC